MSRINKILKSIDFLEYISRPMEKKEIELILKINGFVRERAILMLDFTESLSNRVTKTYLGDYLTSDEDKVKHFDWCWVSVINDFKKEFIYFDKKSSLYDYFFSLFLELFYKEANKEENNLEKTLFFIINTFNYIKIKTKSELDNFLDLYKIFNKNFNVGL